MNSLQVTSPTRESFELKRFVSPWLRHFRSAAWLAGVAALVVLAQTVRAQTAIFISSDARVTVPLNYNGSAAFTNVCKISGAANPVDLSLSGLPAGVTYSIAAAVGGPLGVDNGLPSATISTNLLITLNLNGSVPEGLYPVTVNASGGATNSWNFYLQVAALWTGADYAAGVNTNWNDNGNWAAGTPPGVNDDVVFAQPGATNAATQTNIVLSANASVASVRFAPTNSTQKFYTMLINPGVTLTLTGTNGFSMMKDFENIYSGLGGMTVELVGGGSLVVSNQNAQFLDLIDNAQASTLDMSGLANLYLNVSTVALGDAEKWPFFRILNDLNANGGEPREYLPTVNFARTNIIIASAVDPYNYTNGSSRSYSMSFLNSELTGTSTQPTINLGISNAFYMDSVNFVGPNCQGKVNFNAAFAASNSVATFQNTNGGRMSVFSISDGGGDPNVAHSNIKSTIDFSAGILDLFADRLYIGRDRPIIDASGTPGYQGFLNMGRGLVDVNTAILGYRQYGNFTNAAGYNGYCEGKVTIVSNGVFRVNSSLTLGYGVQTNSGGVGSAGNTDYGQVIVLNGAQFLANNVLVGGPVYPASGNNFIQVTNATFSLSNSIASAAQLLDEITFANGSQFNVTLNATNTFPCVYATNFIITGSNSLVIAGIKNSASLVNGLQIPLFQWATGTAPNFTLFNQSGVNGQVIVDPNVNNQLDFQVILSTPKTLEWQGYASADWDNATFNWLDKNTGLHTNFAAGDNVLFDDSSSVTNIMLDSSAVLLPGSITVTNTVNGYVFNNNGGGNISGTSTLTKSGAGSLEFDGPATISLVINNGSLIGGGTVGAVTVGPAAVMSFNGIINGTVNVSGLGVNNGTINAPVVAQSGGVFTNLSTVNGAFSVQTGGYFYNSGTINYAPGNSAIGTNAWFVNAGTINGDQITVGAGGTYEDIGAFTSDTWTSLTVNSGGTFIPGGSGIGTTTINSDGVGSFPGALLLTLGSTTVFQVNFANPQTNTLVVCDHLSFGASASAQTQNGGTLIITNTGATAFSAGQYFQLFNYTQATGTSTNTYPVISPASPGPGLTWDLSQLWTAGAIGVISQNQGLVLTNSFGGDGTGTNFIGQFSWALLNPNNASSYTPGAYNGYRLETQVNPLTIGLSNNWTAIAGSTTNTSLTITNAVNGTNCVFYRLAFP